MNCLTTNAELKRMRLSNGLTNDTCQQSLVPPLIREVLQLRIENESNRTENELIELQYENERKFKQMIATALHICICSTLQIEGKRVQQYQYQPVAKFA